jgi:hypothetical protein
MESIVKRFLFAFLLGALPAPLPAQLGKVQLRAKIEKLTKAPTCSPRATHRVACTGIYLRAGKGIDLKTFEGKVAFLEGGLDLAFCPTIVVSKAEKARYTLRISPFFFGNYRLGERVSFRVTAPFLSIVPFVFAGRPGFLPLGTFGTYELDLLRSFWFKTDVAVLGFTFNLLKIPKDPSLVGMTILSQGMYLKTDGKTVDAQLLNADCFVIRK